MGFDDRTEGQPIGSDERAGARRIANCFIIGAAKSATTRLFHLLCMHPHVVGATRKEPSFFSMEKRYALGLEWYAQQFDPRHEDNVLLDGSVQYSSCTTYPNAAERIAKHVPESRFIYMMRHPIDRAFSHYQHRWIKELHPGEPFTETFEQFIEHQPGVVEDSRYKLQIEHYLNYFPRERFLLLLHDDMYTHEESLLRQACAHFGLSYDGLPSCREQANVRSNVSNEHLDDVARLRVTGRWKSHPVGRMLYRLTTAPMRQWAYRHLVSRIAMARELKKLQPAPMRPETRRELGRYFEPDIAWAEQWLGRDLQAWRA